MRLVSAIKKKLFKKQKTKLHPLQTIGPKSGLAYKKLGSDYGGWVFVDGANLEGSTIISAGLGEDASFDVEFAREYNATVIIIDPTPRAIRHFNDIADNLGSARKRPYQNGGQQPIDSYELSNLENRHFRFVEKALWNAQTKIKFFTPKDESHVSHSIVNYQNSYAQDTDYIEVQASPILDVIMEMNLNPDNIPLVKLDIEGAEVEVITDFLAKGFYPEQILVEFDEFNMPSPKGNERIESVHKQLLSHGYECVRTDGRTDFLYVQKT